jgi:hypothetical protein
MRLHLRFQLVVCTCVSILLAINEFTICYVLLQSD